MLPPYDAGNDPDRNRVVAGQLCSRLATIECAGEAHCCNAPGRSVSACETEVAKGCNDTLYLDQIAQNRVTGFDPNATLSAFTELENRTARCDLEIPQWSLTAEGLRGILKGTIAPGASCKPANALTADKPTQAAALASCTGIGTTACLPKSLLTDWICAPQNGVGGSCITDDNCQPGLYCNSPNMMIGKCAQRLDIGASCAAGTNCQSFYCWGGRCVAADQQVAFCLKQ